jgi:signal recognition particle subunit SEC65
MTLSPIDFSAYSPVEYSDFVKIFESTGNNSPGMSLFGKRSLRVHAILHEFPKDVNNTDINNIKNTLRSLGFNPDMSSQFGYKVEYVFPSRVEWEKETRLIFYIQKVQRQHFEKEYKLNDPIYWFLVFNQFNTFTQRGYILISDFISKEQFIKYKLE